MSISHHVLWGLSDRGVAVAQWLRVLRPGGRVAVFDGDWGGLSAHDVAALLVGRGCVAVGIDRLEDLGAALDERAEQAGRTRDRFVRYLVWGDKPP